MQLIRAVISFRHTVRLPGSLPWKERKEVNALYEPFCSDPSRVLLLLVIGWWVFLQATSLATSACSLPSLATILGSAYKSTAGRSNLLDRTGQL